MKKKRNTPKLMIKKYWEEKEEKEEREKKNKEKEEDG